MAQRARSIVNRVVADGRAAHDPFEGLTRIGIDEISYKKGHRYLTIVVDHDSGRLVWAAVGRDKKTLGAFFDLLGEERCQAIHLISADGAGWIGDVVAERAKNATLCIDRVSCRAVGQRRPRRGPPPGVERGEEERHAPRGQGAEGLSLRPVAQP